ncbi:hypothetical protein I204_06100 [Kwoniella mangroviensis CBS 8886]|uniref:uncharacterized protein n=1 Tax=Kwoniella mangroviensis CBS 8507 TaxID=1296122 RepID=UPI00080D39DB|nr:uncharacterized protein I203_03322 [Kwoniella mangroviensis CBS 8507]OCF67625.1 hypothetical protein I203_03322 [Kwoniella mangroviensis CBS 8507]OCF72871.1 hypothetical protein I204_06100 [Kwoniella mangroviensis CBS 8886]
MVFGFSHSHSSNKEKKESPVLDSSSETDLETATVKTDDVFGTISEDGPNYRNVGWLGTTVLLIKSQIGVGVLSVPSTLAVLGIVPGIICLWVISGIICYSDYVVGQFKRRHPQVYGIDDVGHLLFKGRLGREVIAVMYWLFMTCVAASGLLGISIGLNAISSHGTCTAVFVAVATVVTFFLSCIQTLGKISWLGWVGLVSIMSALLTLTIAVGVEDRPATAPQDGAWDKGLVIWGQPTFTEAITAVSALVFAFTGTPAFFGIVSEMRDQRKYTQSMLLSQSFVTAVDTVVGVVVYYYCGQFVASPALGSAGGTLKKICYGLALPGLFVTAMMFTHLPAKFLFVRLLRGSKHLTNNSTKHYAVWYSCVIGCVLFSYIIASAIPVFDGIASLVGALFGTVLCIQLMAGMWLYDNWEKRTTNKTILYKFLLFWNIFMIALGSFLMVAGTYGAVIDIRDSYAAAEGAGAWSCRDNSS